MRAVCLPPGSTRRAAVADRQGPQIAQHDQPAAEPDEDEIEQAQGHG